MPIHLGDYRELDMNHALTLETVQRDFQQWRLNRKKRASIPDDLWQRVFSLLNRYPISKICSVLSLNTAQIRSKLKPDNSNSKETFVEVSLKSAPMNNVKGEISIRFLRKDGASLLITSFPSNAINSLIDHFLMG